MRARAASFVQVLALSTAGFSVAAVAVAAPDQIAKRSSATKPATKPIGSESLVPDAEKPQRAEQALVRMRQGVTRMLALRDEARQLRDVVRLTCVSDKVVQANGLLRISEQADQAMREAIFLKDKEVSANEFTKLELARNKTEVIRHEAELCVGEHSVYSGDTVITVEGGPRSSSSLALPLPDSLLQRPPPASPYE